MGKSTVNIIVILGLITILFAGYYLYSQKTATILDFATGEVTSEEMLIKTQAFIGYGTTLSAVRLDLTMFEDAHFRALKSFSTPIEERPAGRANPFLETAAANAAVSAN